MVGCCVKCYKFFIIKKLIINRNEFYAKADYKIECEKKTKLEIVEKIIKNYEKL